YLANIPSELAQELFKIGEEYNWQNKAEIEAISKDFEEINKLEIPRTQKQQLIEARIGQGKFREGVMELYPFCPVTGIEFPCILRASHIKPWRVCNNQERLDPYNGIILAANIDALFDKGYISFTDAGNIVVSQVIETELHKLGIDKSITIPVYKNTIPYLQWHRKNLFVKKHEQNE
ncbi:MAG: HNH endonuclease, partial [Alistipes sp.]|nr:HNH endonuclease [Alistipes sp.]